MTLAVAFVPSAPVLIPDVGVDSSPELDDLRTAAIEAVRDVVRDASHVVVVAAGSTGRLVEGPVRASFAGFGVDREIGAGELVQWPAGIALWLLTQAGWQGSIDVVECDDDVTASSALVVQALTAADAVIVVGDGSAGLGPKAPGYVIDGAHDFDTALAAALASGDASALALLNAAEGQRVQAAGVPVFRALGVALSERAIDASLRLHTSPFGVGYFVATWRST